MIILALKKLICSESFKERARETKKDFTRDRKLKLADYILIMFQRWNTSLSATVRQYTDEMGMPECSRQAFSQGRRKIKAEAVRELIHWSAAQIYAFPGKTEKWKGLRVLAIDGSRINLPESSESRTHFGFQKSTGEQIQGLFSGLYDVLNRFFLDAALAPCNASERDLAIGHVQHLHTAIPSLTNDSIILFDRGYPGAEIMWEIGEKTGQKYLMRCCKEFIRSMKLSGDDCTIHYCFRKLKKEVKLRVVRFQLPDGSTEILVTNLFSECTIDDFKKLYHMRWGIETAYAFLKNRLELENYSSLLPKGILQDTYGAIIMMNLIGSFMLDLRQNGSLSARRNYNHTEAYRLLKENLIRLFCYRIPRYSFFLALLHKASKFYTYVKSGRHFERTVQHKTARFHSNNRGS